MDNTISSSGYQSQVPIKNSINTSISSQSNISTIHSPVQQQSDKVSLSSESISRNTQIKDEETNRQSVENSFNDNADISSEQLREIQKLQQRDAEVKAHEQAHLSTAGQYAAGGASFSYTTGPNGKRYATGGEVPIDLSKEKDPQATLMKMTQVRRAALAPANPSAADRNIAARASMIAADAMSEINSTAGKKINTENSPQLAQQEDSSTQNTSSMSSIDNRTFPSPGDTKPTHTRHMVLQAYAVHS